MSPLAGIVEATLLTFASGVRNVALLAGADAVVLDVDVEVLELELPQPASTTATPARARIEDLGTRNLLWLDRRVRMLLECCRPSGIKATPDVLVAFVAATSTWRRRSL